MNIQCPKCGSYNTYSKNPYQEESEAVCFDCHAFFTTRKPEINWKYLTVFLIMVISAIIILYFSGWLK